MKKRIGILFVTMIMLATMVFAAFPEEGETNHSDGLIVFEPKEDAMTTEILENDFYEMEKQVTLQKVVDGNAYIMAESVKIDGAIIYGNVCVMAQEIEITNSDIRGSIYAMGQTIKMAGQTNDLYAMGESVILAEDCVITRDAKIGAAYLEVRGNVERNLDASVDKLNVTDSAMVGRKFTYFSNKEGTISETAQLTDVEFKKMEQKGNQNSAADYVMDVVEVAFKTLIIALIILFFVRKFKSLPRENSFKNVLQLIGKGAAVLLLIPVVSILLILTTIGATLGVSLLAFYSILLYLAATIAALEIASQILKQEKSNGKLIGLTILIAIVIWAIGFIPNIGAILQFILVLMGLGVLCDMIFKRIKNEK